MRTLLFRFAYPKELHKRDSDNNSEQVSAKAKESIINVTRSFSVKFPQEEQAKARIMMLIIIKKIEIFPAALFIHNVIFSILSLIAYLI